jgi:hypothetical protein
VDGKRFDALTQRLASIRLSRKGALRGLVGGVVALTGGAAVTDRVAAGKPKPYCACETATSTCTEATGKKKARKRYIQQHPCSYEGPCRGSGSHNPCDGAGAQITVTVNALDLIGVGCTGNRDCGGNNSGLECLDVVGLGLICVPRSGGTIGDPCNADDDCATGRCDEASGECVNCPEPSRCGSGGNAQCCSLLATCGVLDVCLLPL